MKIEKLELRHICGYLPWGLRADVNSKIFLNPTLIGLRKIFADFNYYGSNISFEIEKVKPLLLPLSALTEPLEDGTVPAIEIAKLCDNGHNHSISKIKTYTGLIIVSTDICDYVENVTIRISHGISVEMGGSYVTITTAQRIFEYLYSKHFDIYGLIDSGLAIDKRTIKI